jgi:hypothetical protein
MQLARREARIIETRIAVASFPGVWGEVAEVAKVGRHWGKLMPDWTGFRGMIWGKNHSINGLVERPLQWIHFFRILSLSLSLSLSLKRMVVPEAAHQMPRGLFSGSSRPSVSSPRERGHC